MARKQYTVMYLTQDMVEPDEYKTVLNEREAKMLVSFLLEEEGVIDSWVEPT